MSKEELLKYLIAEIDLIMHDKDYRFENQDGTWYSRESCRDLTNEEVFKELKGELRQLADLESKLAELEQENRELHTSINLSIPNQIAMKDEIERLHTCIDKRISELVDENDNLKQQLAESEEKYAELFCRNTELETLYSQKTALLNFYKDTDLVKKNKKLKQQLAEKEKQLSEYSDINNALNNGLADKCISCEEEYNQDKISFAVEWLRKAKFDALMLGGLVQGETFFINSEHYRSYIDNQIASLKKGVE